MLSAAHRITESRTFTQTTRAGRRASSRRLVTYLDRPEPAGGPAGDAGSVPVRVGFVVGRGVGNSVVRHRVQRRLRHLVREHLPALPPASVLVVRALPAAHDASSADLRADLGTCLRRLGVLG